MPYEIKKTNCVNCAHSVVCSIRAKYESIVDSVSSNISTMDVDNIIEPVDIKCKHFAIMYNTKRADTQWP